MCDSGPRAGLSTTIKERMSAGCHLTSPSACNRETPYPRFTGSESGLRFLHPVMGRWPSRDPIGERGGACIYGFVQNAPSMLFDAQGLASQTAPGDLAWPYVPDSGGKLKGNDAAVTFVEYKFTADGVHISKNGCCCWLDSASKNVQVVTYIRPLNDISFWSKLNADDVFRHENVHRDADYYIGDQGFACSTGYLKKKCQTRWFGRNWTMEGCRSAQQKELDRAAAKLKQWADKEVYEASHEYIGDHQGNWNPDGVNTFNAWLALWAGKKLFPDNEYW